MKHSLLSFSLTLLFALPLQALAADSPVQALQARWAEISYRLPEKDRDEAFDALTGQADEAIAAHPNSAELWIWRGIVKSSHAGTRGGLGALSLVKAAKTDLERAIKLDGNALNGAAYTTLGSLYYQVPGWPIGFGSDKKAEKYLRQGLAVAADDIDANYFYADFLYQSGDYKEARRHLERALHAPPRAGRQLADEGRREEIRALLRNVEEKSR